MNTILRSPSFGAWLEKKRGAMSMRDFAALTGVDAGTISRTEHDCTEIRFETALSICNGLGLSLADLLADWLGRTLPERYRYQSEGQSTGVLTVVEIERWLQRIVEGQRRSRELLIAALNLLVLHSGIAQPKLPQLGNLFVLSDVDKLLWDLPFFRFEVAPPLHAELLDALDVRVFQKAGVLLPVEIGTFVRRLRERSELSPKKVCDQFHVPKYVLSYIEDGAGERLLLGHLLQLDDALELQGLLVAFFWWEAEARLHLEAAWQQWPQAAVYMPASLQKTVALLISVGRWLQYIYGDDTTWFRMVRHELGLDSSCITTGGCQ